MLRFCMYVSTSECLLLLDISYQYNINVYSICLFVCLFLLSTCLFARCTMYLSILRPHMTDLFTVLHSCKLGLGMRRLKGRFEHTLINSESVKEAVNI